MSLQNNHIADEIDCYLHEVLTPAEKKQVEEHIQECETCRAALEEGKKRFDILRNVAASEAGNDLVQKTLARVNQHEQAILRRQKLLIRWSIGGVAAVILLFAGSQIYQARLKPSPYDLRVIGQSQFFANADAQVRVSVVDQTKSHNAGVKNVPVRVEIASSQGEFIELVSADTDAEGNAQPKFHLPDWKAGSYNLRISARPGGSAQVITRPVELRSDWKPASASTASKLMLSSDRPVYQPGQVIKVRSLALRNLDLKPVAGQKVVFSIIDPRDNVIFKHKDVTSQYGISSCECPLAAEIMEGTYAIQCVIGESQSQRLQVEVMKYVLPRFKIEVVLEKPFFQPGDKIKGKVRAHYFFGKPVGEGRVELDWNDGEFKRTVNANAEGEAEFAFLDIPATTWERNSEGIVNLDMQVRVTDKAGQTQTRKVPVILAKRALRIEMIPEAGTLVAGLANTVFVLVTTADGKPAQARVMISGHDKELLTNELGFAQFQFTPQLNVQEWTVRAQDKDGQTGSRQVRLKSENDVLLRTDKAVYKGGDVVRLDAWRNGPVGELFVDVVKDGLTLWTQPLVKAEVSGKDGPNFTANVQLPVDLFGAIELRVYRLTNEQVTEFRPRVIHVAPPGQVLIAMTADKAEYLPGKHNSAELAFRLTDANKNPVAGALSLAAVDEAVFAVLQQPPGSEASFFGADPQFVSTAESTAGATEERQLYQRAIAARSMSSVKERATTGDGKATTFTLSTHWESVRNIEAKRKTFSTAMAMIWTVLFYLSLLMLVVFVVFLVVKFFYSLGSSDRRWWFELSFGTAFFLCVISIVVSFFFSSVENANKTFTNVSSTMANVGATEAESADDRSPPAPPAGRKLAPLKKREPERFPIVPLSSDVMKNAVTKNAPPPRIRDYFPETLEWKPELITNDKGEVNFSLRLADSITNWRLSTSAVTAEGRLGARTDNIKVFQPFFVDVRLPVALIRGDEVAVPVVVYNYLDKAQKVTLSLAEADWFDRLDQAEKVLTLQPQDQVKATSFRIKVKKAGFHEMTVQAVGRSLQTGERTHADAIRPKIEVIPNGRPIERAWNGALLQATEIDVTVPEGAVEDSARLLLKIYPSTFSQALEGLESIIKMPSGCFEQTSSSTYPNVLALDYLKRTKKRNPKVEEQASAFIQQGYQRLLSFEVKGGGFDWFGHPPANRTLTAYGLLEFQDMARVHQVDPKLIERTREWLLDQRQIDGSWRPEGHVPAGLPGQHISGTKLAQLSTTSYIAWAVFSHKASSPSPLPPGGEGRVRGDQASPTRQFILSHRPAEIADPHVLALVCNALLALSPADAAPYLGRLEALKKTSADGKQVFWTQADSARTTFHGHGQSGQVETTALATLALMEAGKDAGTINAALSWLIGQRDPRGTWYSTQATVLALKALLAGNAVPAAVERRILVDFGAGRQQTITIGADQSEVMKMENFTKYLRPGANKLTLTDLGGSGAGYQVTLRYHEPDAKRQGEPFTIEVRYDKQELRVDEVLPVTAKVRNQQPETAAMVMIELPAPAGFEIQVDDWAKLVQEKKIAKYEIKGQRILVYLRDLAPGGKGLELSYRLEAKMPLRIQVPAGRVYEYYDPAQTASSATAALTVVE
jgi:hypothetical protein